jgi:signal transduction histidine kinase
LAFSSIQGEEQNKQLSEYAFINAHHLRAPLSNILGLINVLQASELSSREKEIVRHLYDSGMKLDEIIHRIADTLERGNQINRSDLSKKNSIRSK